MYLHDCRCSMQLYRLSSELFHTIYKSLTNHSKTTLTYKYINVFVYSFVESMIEHYGGVKEWRIQDPFIVFPRRLYESGKTWLVSAENPVSVYLSAPNLIMIEHISVSRPFTLSQIGWRFLFCVLRSLFVGI